MNNKYLWNKQKFIVIISIILSGLFTNSTLAVEEAENWQRPTVAETESKTLDPCLLLSPKIVIDDGQGETRIWLEMTNKMLVLKTKSDIDTAFNDIGLQIDDKDFIPLDRINNDVDILFEKSIAEIIQQFIHGQNVKLQLRFWPTWPSKGIQTAEFSLLGFTKAYKSLSEQCKNSIENSQESTNVDTVDKKDPVAKTPISKSPEATGGTNKEQSKQTQNIELESSKNVVKKPSEGENK